MAMCPFATRMLLTEPKSFGKGQNGTIERIVVHHTGVKRAVTPNHARSAWNWWTSQSQAGKKTSAHFVIEADGGIVQLVDTDDIGYGTGTYTGHAVHLEHAGSGEPFTRAQLHASALLIGWIKAKHSEVSLTVVGQGLMGFGDTQQKGITCHAWVDQAAIKAKHPYAPKAAKLTCPGLPMLGAIPELARLGNTYVAAAPFVTSPAAVAATSFFDWASGSPVSR